MYINKLKVQRNIMLAFVNGHNILFTLRYSGSSLATLNDKKISIPMAT